MLLLTKSSKIIIPNQYTIIIILFVTITLVKIDSQRVILKVRWTSDDLEESYVNTHPNNNEPQMIQGRDFWREFCYDSM